MTSRTVAARAYLLRALLVITLVVASAIDARPGDLDPTFGQAGAAVLDRVRNNFNGPDNTALVVDNAGRVLLGGSCSVIEQSVSTIRFCVARILSSGVLDESFGDLGVSVGPSISGYLDIVTAIGIQSDGRIVAAGYCGDPVNSQKKNQFCAARFDASGQLDTSFGSGGIAAYDPTTGADVATAMLVSNDDTLVLAGNCDADGPAAGPRTCLIQTNQDGVIDPAYGIGGLAAIPWQMRVASIVRGSDNAVIVSGSCFREPGIIRICAARVAADGVVDASYDPASLLPANMHFSEGGGSVLFSDDSLVIGGRCDAIPSDACLMGVTAAGQLNPTFGTNGVVRQSFDGTEWYSPLIRTTTGRLVLGGFCSAPSGVCLAAFSPAGTVDSSFGNFGVAKPFFDFQSFPGQMVAAQDDKFYIVMPNCDGTNRLCVARFRGGPYAITSCALNVSANSATLLPNATLIVRYLMGLRGTALTGGAVSANTGRTGPEIENYLAALLMQGKLDADGDGQSLAMTDALLILRAMLGLSGAALTNGATNAAHPNARNAQQILTWIEETHGVACLP